MIATSLTAIALAVLSVGMPPPDPLAIDLAREVSSPSPPARGRLLVASQNLIEPTFARTVVVLLAYDQSGAFGVVINRPTTVRLATALPQIEALRGRTDVVFLGGPVGLNRMLALIRSSRPLKSGKRVFDDVYVSGSLDALRRALAPARKPSSVRVYAGSAGWGPGQLDREIARGDWYVAEPDARFIFENNPAEVWDKLIQRFSGEWTRLYPESDAPTSRTCAPMWRRQSVSSGAQ